MLPGEMKSQVILSNCSSGGGHKEELSDLPYKVFPIYLFTGFQLVLHISFPLSNMQNLPQ